RRVPDLAPQPEGPGRARQPALRPAVRSDRRDRRALRNLRLRRVDGAPRLRLGGPPRQGADGAHGPDPPARDAPGGDALRADGPVGPFSATSWAGWLRAAAARGRSPPRPGSRAAAVRAGR